MSSIASVLPLCHNPVPGVAGILLGGGGPVNRLTESYEG